MSEEKYIYNKKIEMPSISSKQRKDAEALLDLMNAGQEKTKVATRKIGEGITPENSLMDDEKLKRVTTEQEIEDGLILLKEFEKKYPNVILKFNGFYGNREGNEIYYAFTTFPNEDSGYEKFTITTRDLNIEDLISEFKRANEAFLKK